MTRVRLPNRRPAETVMLEHDGARMHERRFLERRPPHLEHDAGVAIDVDGCVDEHGAAPLVVGVGEKGGLASAALDKHLGAVFDETPDGVGHERNAALAPNGFPRYSDTHQPSMV